MQTYLKGHPGCNFELRPTSIQWHMSILVGIITIVVNDRGRMFSLNETNFFSTIIVNNASM